MDVFLVWHVHHAAFADGRPTEHRDADGALTMDDEDDCKVLGAFSSAALAQGRIDRARTERGFADEPECFLIDAYTVDEDRWLGGYATLESEPT